MALIYNYAMNLMGHGDFDWEDDDVRVILLKGTIPTDRTDPTVSAVISGGTSELADASYDRVTLTGRQTIVNNTSHRIEYTGDAIAFEALAGEETITSLLIYKHVTDDSDSIPIYLEDGLDAYETAPSPVTETYFPASDGYFAVRQLP